MPSGERSKTIQILAVDDSEEALYVLEQLLAPHGYVVQKASNGAEALRLMESSLPDLVLTDANMPVMDGYTLTAKIKGDALMRYIPVVLVTANDELDDVVHGLEKGADDYIKKPYKSAELLARIQAAMRVRQLYRELKQASDLNKKLNYELSDRHSFSNIVGKSEAMQQVFSLIEKVADSDVPVLISGESGTGKELVAAAIHYHSPRSKQAFIVQNCSAFNENLLESELFGHVKGAFTGAIKDKEGLFEAADGGTFFLDELGEMSPALQVKLLRVLQDGSFIPVGSNTPKKVNVRILAATNRNLREMVEKGTFREDLFYRLNVVNVQLPALRDRRVDIPLLVEYFLERNAKRSGKPRKSILDEVLLLLSDYNWPGNIRELQNEVERLILMSGQQNQIGLDLVSPHILAKVESLSAPEGERNIGKLKEAIEKLEREMIAAALKKHSDNRSETAKELGISRSNLIAKIQLFGL